VHRQASGSIIDFVQVQQGLSLGAVRKELRPWIGASPVAVPVFPALVKTTKDRVSVETRFNRMKEVLRHPYLETERCLPPTLLESSRFESRVRMNDRGNAVFPYFDADGLCGYEIKNKAIAAMDADEVGADLADIVRGAVLSTGRDDLVFVSQEPSRFKDWNDEIRARPSTRLLSYRPRIVARRSLMNLPW
jgi:hypothetical protein